jgi:hypothetical protein
MILGDAGLHKVSKEAYIKFEQGYKQKEFIEDLYNKFRLYTFMESIGTRYNKNTDIIKSYWFKTYSYKTFTELWDLFYNKDNLNKGKIIKPNLIINELNGLGLTYWIMSDGSLQKDKKTLIFHTQNYTEEMNNILSKELNYKFNLHSKVIKHKGIYTVISIPDNEKINRLIKNNLIKSMLYKLPKN